MKYECMMNLENHFKSKADMFEELNILYKSKADFLDALANCEVNIISSIKIETASSVILINTTTQLIVKAQLSDGSTCDITSKATFASSDSSIASVNANGLVAGISPGSVQITASLLNFTAVQTLEVINPVSVRELVFHTVPSTLLISKTSSFAITAHYSDGTTKDLTSTASYDSSDSNIATVTEDGVVTGISKGYTELTASLMTFKVIEDIKVEEEVFFTGLTIHPTSAEVIEGKSMQLTVTAHFSDDSTQNFTTKVNYSSSDSTIAEVSNTGLVTVHSLGIAEITASISDYKAMSQIKVKPKLIGLSIDPSYVCLLVGRNRKLFVTAYFSDGTTENYTDKASYSSSDSNIAAVDETGYVTSTTEGIAYITAVVEEYSAVAEIEIISGSQLVSIEIQPADATVSLIYMAVNYVATGTYANGATFEISNSVEWSSSDINVVEMYYGTRWGLLSSEGHATITAKDMTTGITGTTTITVTA